MKKIPLEDHIIGISEILKIPEKEVMEAIFDTFKDKPNCKEILEDIYWEFQDDNQIKNYFQINDTKQLN